MYSDILPWRVRADAQSYETLASWQLNTDPSPQRAQKDSLSELAV